MLQLRYVKTFLKGIVISMLKQIKSFFSGSFESYEERKKFSTLGVLFGITIGVYWLLRPIKDSVFMTMVGIDYQPMVKML